MVETSVGRVSPIGCLSFYFLPIFSVVVFFRGEGGGGAGLLEFLFLRGFWCVFIIITAPSLQAPSM
jgi:hypothetical protein